MKAIYDGSHEYLESTWKECYRVLVDGGIACINIGDATRTINERFRLFTNHSRTIELFEKIGFVTLPYILWRKPTTKPNAFLGSGFLPSNAYVTLDQEFIVILRKGGPRKFETRDTKRYASVFTKEERDSWFTQTWVIPGTKQENSEMGRRVGSFQRRFPGG